MKKMTLTLFARTPVHVGAGNSVGAIDSPIQRERHTRIPIIPGSSLKGVISDLWNDDAFERTESGKTLFGEDDTTADAKAGSLLIGEARVLAFPVRSAKGMFAWLTAPVVLNRFKRDTGADFVVPDVQGETALAFESLKLRDQVVLEEYNFNVTGEPGSDLIEALKSMVENDPVWSGISKQLVVVSNEIFQHFCEHACEVVTRIKVDDEKGTVVPGALFNQEQVPSETLFYTTIMAQEAANLETLKTKLEKEQWLQVGGDATTGLGFCSINCQEIKS
ncbi:MAG: type III-B CRISPR module RAMP protein Cmr4 [Pontiella sp.]